MAALSTTDGLKTQANELVKQYIVYDGTNRMTAVYTAPSDATDGKPCTKVTYTYTSPTSSLISKMKESNDVWSSAYDI